MGSKNVVVTIRSYNGNALGLERASQDHNRLVADEGQGAEFCLVEDTVGGISLLLKGTSLRITARNAPLLTVEEVDVGPDETFNIVYFEGRMIALQLADGSGHIDIPTEPGMPAKLIAGEALPTGSVVLEFKKFADGTKVPHSCGGPYTMDSEGPEPQWDDHTHWVIVDTAVKLLGSFQRQSPLARWVYRRWFGDPLSPEGNRGLRDADYKMPWARTQDAITFWYNDHFYDPATRKNYRGENSSAVTVGAHAFNQSVDMFAKNPYKAAYQLGLSLHFLTDLQQPMHAANFTNIHRPLLAHTTFEIYADKKVKEGYLNNYPSGDFEAIRPRPPYDASHFLHRVSLESKKIFVSDVRKPLDGMRPMQPRWRSQDADPILRLALWPSPVGVARFLMMWAHMINEKHNLGLLAEEGDTE